MQLLRSIEARRPNMHFDKGVSAREVKTLLSRAERMTSGMHEKKESPLVQLNQIQELNAIEKKEAHLQHAMESGAGELLFTTSLFTTSLLTCLYYHGGAPAACHEIWGG